MKTSNQSQTLAEKISERLKKAQIEIEEFALQFALGKAEAADKFEELKKEFKSKVSQLQSEYSESGLKSKIEDLKLQLTLGKADAKDLFEEQRKNILKAIHKIEDELKSNPKFSKGVEEFSSELEKFKLKLEILKLQFELKRSELKDEFKDALAEAGIKIEKLFTKVEGKLDDVKRKSYDFSDEIKLSYEHLKKAVKSF